MADLEWEPIEREWFDTRIDNCDVCGRVLGRRALLVQAESHSRRVCDETCARLFAEYWLPRYGSTAAVTNSALESALKPGGDGQ
jgi:hypothetical protein